MDGDTFRSKLDFVDTVPLVGDGRPTLSQVAEPRIALCIQQSPRAQVHPLSPDVPVTVGRSAPSDVQIDARTLSRRHACFVLSDGRVVVEDLGSKNGTFIAGARAQRAELDVGDEVVLGDVPVRVELVGASGEPLGLEGERRFVRQLEEELVRARALRRTFALLTVARAADPSGDGANPEPQEGVMERWLAHVRGQLRAVDRVALYGPEFVQILLPEAPSEQAATIARAIATVPAGVPALRVGTAAYPEAAHTVEALIDASRRAAQRASAATPFQAASAAMWRESGPAQEGELIAGNAMRTVLDEARDAANSRIPILLQGETGTGKEVLAHFIHHHGPRHAKPMVCVNCAAIPSQLVESTLFGHEKGAFTGADRQQKGVFEAADGGSVFLDEIGELPPPVQAALLRVLETGTFCRVGSTREVRVDVRLIAATHRDLEALAERDDFRRDLLFRLNTMTLTIPPLRERVDEVKRLAQHFLQLANESNRRSIQGIEDAAMERLQAYPWPGNVRELRNAIERAVVVARGALIGVSDLPVRVQAGATLRPLAPAPQRHPAHVPELPAPTPAPSNDPGTDLDPPAASEATGDLKSLLLRYEAKVVRKTLEATDWSRREAARRLGIPVRTLAHRIKVLGIRRPSR